MYENEIANLGSVVQSIVSLTSSLRGQHIKYVYAGFVNTFTVFVCVFFDKM